VRIYPSDGGRKLKKTRCAKTPRVSDWNVIAADPSKLVLSIDLQSITPVGLPAEGKRQAWFKSVFVADWPIINTQPGAKQAAQRMELIYVDCQRRRSATKQWIIYDKSGNTLASGDRPVVFDPDYSDVIPDSLGVQMIAAACGAKK
jgi:hypothetical protein